MSEMTVGNSMQADEAIPVISVITAVFNGAKTLRETINSVVPQLNEEIEYIIIDGGSKDGTVEIIKENSAHLSYWISEKDKGIYDAWNKGLLVARGRYVAFLGADDALESGALRAYLSFMGENPEVEYVSSRIAFGHRHGRVIGRAWRWSEFRRFMTVAHVGSMHRRDLYERYGLYNTNYRIVGDYEFLLRVGAGLKAGFLDKVTVVMGAEGVSNNSASKAIRETYEAKINTRSTVQVVALLDLIVALVKVRIKAALTK